MITSLHLLNFKPFANQLLEFKKLTLFSGLNSTGKSSVMQSLLLLRQSYKQGLLPEKGLALNGDFVNIGTAQDALFEGAKEDLIGFGIVWENNSKGLWRFRYDKEVDVLNITSEPVSSEVYKSNLFGNEFHYLQAERIGPRPFNEMSDYQVRQLGQLGIKGEYAAHFLAINGQKAIPNSSLSHPEAKLKTQRDLSSAKSMDLIDQVEAWMGEISPGTRLKIDAKSDLATKTPLSVDISDLKIQIKVEDPDCELSLQGSQAEGFKVAHYLETLAISLNSELLWNSSRIKLELTQIDENGELIEESVEVIHASQKNHVIEHDDWIQKRQLTGVVEGLELWNRRAELFSSLEFCDRVSQQIQSLVDPTMLRQVVRKLFELDELSKNWTDGSLDLDNLPSKVSPESESRLKQFREQLNIQCLDGTKRIFSLHVRLTPGAWRLHFCTELGPGKIVIGYIGPKIQ